MFHYSRDQFPISFLQWLRDYLSDMGKHSDAQIFRSPVCPILAVPARSSAFNVSVIEAHAKAGFLLNIRWTDEEFYFIL